MKRVLSIVVVLALLLLVADFGLRAAAQNAAADLIDKEIPQDVDPTVELGGFPFLLSVLRGSFDEIRVSMPRARKGALVVEDISLDFEDVKLEALEVLGGRGNLRAASVRGRGVIGEATLNRVVQDQAPDILIAIEDARVTVSRGDISVAATAVVANDAILIKAGRILGPLEIPLPALLPDIRFSSLDARPGELVLGVRALNVKIRA